MSPRIPTNPNNYFGAQLYSPPFERRDAIYPDALPFQTNLDVATARARDHASDRQKVINGHSLGGQALASLMRDDPDADPAENEIALIGF